MSGPSRCFHCQEPIPAGAQWSAQVGGVEQAVCCIGCRAAVEWIQGQGLGDYYRLRCEGVGPGPAASSDYSVLDRPSVQQYYAVQCAPGLYELSLSVEGLRCAACTWLIERALAGVAGVDRVKVHALTQRVTLRWRPERIALSQLAQRLAALGYQPHLADPAREHERIRRERRDAMKRLVVAGVGMMQAMMYGVALYAGAFEGMDPTVRDFFRWVSMAVSAPVIFYAGQPFFLGAWREWQARRLGMDTPVALALALAFLASIYESARGGAEVYFDSLTMFVFFLLLGRFAEQNVRHRAQVSLGVLSTGLPPLARRLRGDEIEEVATLELVAGDEIQVAVGTTVPADGVLLREAADLDEAMLTGESHPVARQPGDTVLAGSLVVSRPVRLQVSRTGAATTISALARMADAAQADKPESLQMAERVARFFIARVLVLTAVTGLIWLWFAPERAFSVALAVLVVSCPCALSLALPTALAAASQGLARLGVLVVRPAALEALAGVRQVVLDKTGTLTDGRIRISHISLAPGVDRAQALALAATLERDAHHPIARAFAGAGVAEVAVQAVQVAGEGVEAVIHGHRYRLGRPQWALEPDHGSYGVPEGDVLLSRDGVGLAGFRLADQQRVDAAPALEALRALGLGTLLVSGDTAPRVAQLADRLGIERWHSDQRPADKISLLERFQALDGPALMVGDGINDAPVLGRAAVSAAMGQGADLAKAHADLILLGQRLTALPQACALSRRTLATIRQNLRWSYGYNALAIPAAALGYVPPWLAAIGMSLSSLIVVWNSMRLARVRDLPGVPRAEAESTYTSAVIERRA